jgi:hypothetical protein
MKRVRYGRDGKFAYRIVDGSTGAIACDFAAFGGDPISGVVKMCSFSDALYTSRGSRHARGGRTS